MMQDDMYWRVNNEPVVALIGQGKMPVQCAELLARNGFDVGAAHSPDEGLRDWAANHGHAIHYQSFADFELWCKTFPYDYLFSIVNSRLLKPELFRTARGLAINYHDGPLPWYAGSNATASALHNGEREHGVAWRVIEERADSGDILKLVMFRDVPGETQGSLDLKCYLAAMRTFQELLTELKTGTYTRAPHDLSRPRFYRRSELPPRRAES
jgi:methionyl-tRNA formyltransferase